MKDFLNKIFCGDCLDLIKDLPKNSVDCIICDPPYFTGMTHGYTKQAELNDLIICKPFYRELFQQFNRVAKQGKTCLYWFCDWRSLGFYLQTMQEANIPVKNCLVWNKGGGAGNFYCFMHEMILFATWNNQFACKGAKNVIDGILGFSVNNRIDGGKIHPAQKPLEIIGKLIKDGSAENDVVLDCFLGSGSTAVAAIQHNRKFIGFEVHSGYFEIAQRRINEALAKKSQELF